MKAPGFCNDFGDRTGCLGTPDPQYTMRFDELGEAPILWCAHCGPEAQEMDRVLSAALRDRPGFEAELEKAMAEMVPRRSDLS